MIYFCFSETSSKYYAKNMFEQRKIHKGKFLNPIHQFCITKVVKCMTIIAKLLNFLDMGKCRQKWASVGKCRQFTDKILVQIN